MRIAHSPKALSVLESLQIQAEQRTHSEPARLENPEVCRQLHQNVREGLGADADPAAVRGVYEESLARIRSIQRELPTTHEDPVFYCGALLMVTEVAQSATELGYRLPDELAIGSVSWGALNAHVITIDEARPEYLVVFNRNVYAFCDLFSRFIASMIAREVESGRAPGRLQRRPPAADEVADLVRIVHFLLRTIEHHRVPDGSIGVIVALDQKEAPPQLAMTPLAQAFKQHIYFSMNAFVVGHELAHVILRIEGNAASETSSEEGAFREELMCDAIACRLAARTAVRHARGVDPHGWQKFGVPGGVFFLSCLDLFEKAAHVQEHGLPLPRVLEELDRERVERNSWRGHPTSLVRAGWVRGVLANECRRANAADDGSWTLEACDWTDNFLCDAWPAVSRAFLERHATREQVKGIVQQLVRTER